jgi:hypothetical protein
MPRATVAFRISRGGGCPTTIPWVELGNACCTRSRSCTLNRPVNGLWELRSRIQCGRKAVLVIGAARQDRDVMYGFYVFVSLKLCIGAVSSRPGEDLRWGLC